MNKFFLAVLLLIGFATTNVGAVGLSSASSISGVIQGNPPNFPNGFVVLTPISVIPLDFSTYSNSVGAGAFGEAGVESQYDPGVFLLVSKGAWETGNGLIIVGFDDQMGNADGYYGTVTDGIINAPVDENGFGFVGPVTITVPEINSFSSLFFILIIMGLFCRFRKLNAICS